MQASAHRCPRAITILRSAFTRPASAVTAGHWRRSSHGGCGTPKLHAPTVTSWLSNLSVTYRSRGVAAGFENRYQLFSGAERARLPWDQGACWRRADRMPSLFFCTPPPRDAAERATAVAYASPRSRLLM